MDEDASASDLGWKGWAIYRKFAPELALITKFGQLEVITAL